MQDILAFCDLTLRRKWIRDFDEPKLCKLLLKSLKIVWKILLSNSRDHYKDCLNWSINKNTFQVDIGHIFVIINFLKPDNLLFTLIFQNPWWVFLHSWSPSKLSKSKEQKIYQIDGFTHFKKPHRYFSSNEPRFSHIPLVVKYILSENFTNPFNLL